MFLSSSLTTPNLVAVCHTVLAYVGGSKKFGDAWARRMG